MKWFLIVLMLGFPVACTGQIVEIPAVVQPDSFLEDGVIAAPTEAPAAGRLRIIERRRAGLTATNVIRVLKEMKASGELEEFARVVDGATEIDISNLSLAVAEHLAGENPQAWEDIDWDQVLEWIEKLLELLIKYLPIIFDLFA